MKYLVIPAFVIMGLIIVLSAKSTGDYVMKDTTPATDKVTSALSTADVPVATDTPIDTSTDTTQPVEQTVAPVVKTTDDYITEYFSNSYFWNLPTKQIAVDGIKQIMADYPDRFTTDNIDTSFTYLRNYFNRPTESNIVMALQNFQW